MDFNEYQHLANKTALGLAKESLIYPTLGYVGEAGEFTEKVKKLWRNKGITKGEDLSLPDQCELMKELGDGLWYIACLATQLNVSLDEIAQLNIAKLSDRLNRDVIASEGDTR